VCGINGILALDPRGSPVDRQELLSTRDRMEHRGPDGAGAWVSADGRIGLAHRRLAIIDLSESGAQPMASADGRLQLTFNGEIYNYRELRAELAAQGVSFRSHSDTEVILALYAREGRRMLGRLRGMFGLALWDGAEGTLLLARDPYGIKPLYYGVRDARLRFASQVKALVHGGALGGVFDPAGIAGFLLWGSVPEPFTLYRDVHALPAGHALVVRDGVVGRPEPYYRFEAEASAGGPPAVEALESTVRAHLVSDVPVALFLSAGLDSSLIAALAARVVPEPLTTLTLRFEAFAGTPLDEAPLAAEIARSLGTRHVERLVRREDFLDLWPAALAAMDQPSIDGFNSFVVSRAAREEGCKVVLSGLGGDEMFGGYDSFRNVPRWWRWSRRLGAVPGLAPVWRRVAALSTDRPKLAGVIDHGASLAGAYFLRRALYLPREVARLLDPGIAREGLAAYDPIEDASKFLGDRARDARGAWEAVHVMESTQFMRNQLLRDADWASMAHSLETRVPLVDVFLRQALAARGFEPARSGGKVAVVRQAAPELPAAVWNRPKSGFSIPVMEWLDRDVDLRTPRGLASRMLALRVLAGFGVDLDARAAAIDRTASAA
jgi:asparagine synthase (glutamine-hydrolysing)